MLQRGTPIQVKVANGDIVTIKGRVTAVPLSLHGIEFSIDCFTLLLIDCDAILGIQWLLTLCSILWVFAQLTMSFRVLEKSVQLKG